MSDILHLDCILNSDLDMLYINMYMGHIHTPVYIMYMCYYYISSMHIAGKNSLIDRLKMWYLDYNHRYMKYMYFYFDSPSKKIDSKLALIYIDYTGMAVSKSNNFQGNILM